jgi:hypothetical protein
VAAVSAGAGGVDASAVFTFIWSVTLLTPVVLLAIFIAWSSTSELGTSPLSVTVPSLTATFTFADLVASLAYNFA